MELKHFGFNHIRLQTIHPGFVDTEAVRDDGIPAPNEISETEAAQFVLNGLKKEMWENMSNIVFIATSLSGKLSVRL